MDEYAFPPCRDNAMSEADPDVIPETCPYDSQVSMDALQFDGDSRYDDDDPLCPVADMPLYSCVELPRDPELLVESQLYASQGSPEAGPSDDHGDGESPTVVVTSDAEMPGNDQFAAARALLASMNSNIALVQNMRVSLNPDVEVEAPHHHSEAATELDSTTPLHWVPSPISAVPVSDSDTEPAATFLEPERKKQMFTRHLLKDELVIRIPMQDLRGREGTAAAIAHAVVNRVPVSIILDVEHVAMFADNPCTPTSGGPGNVDDDGVASPSRVEAADAQFRFNEEMALCAQQRAAAAGGAEPAVLPERVVPHVWDDITQTLRPPGDWQGDRRIH
jgi:hypothetical protein